MAMTPGRIALAALGGVLLLPGVCGVVSLGGGAMEHISRGSWRFSDYEEMLWLVAQPSLMLGCLGLFVLARATGKPGLMQAARLAGWAALAITVAVSAFITYAVYLRSGAVDMEAGSWILWFGFCFLVGGLPALMLSKPAGAEEGR